MGVPWSRPVWGSHQPRAGYRLPERDGPADVDAWPRASDVTRAGLGERSGDFADALARMPTAVAAGKTPVHNRPPGPLSAILSQDHALPHASVTPCRAFGGPATSDVGP